MGLVAVSGSLIELLNAQLLGEGDNESEDSEDEDDDEEDEEEEDSSQEDRSPSATAVSVFAPIGESIAEGLVAAWAVEQTCEVMLWGTSEDALEVRNELANSDVIIAITLSISGALKGQAKLFARPLTLVAPPAMIDAVPATSGAIEEALGDVPVEVVVEFGRATITMDDVAGLKVGTVIPLSHFIDDLLPVQCAGVIKALARPVVYRGVIAVKVGEKAKENQPV